MTTALMIE